ncbi:MAG: hypothetical protein ISR82_04255 [Candidatus Marinimicrobia bacterium]|nr:hypothetical protein [Candidatus Neomarinimicrobiota bacterium]MBL7010413.1 hypothetical protein [Candidatus Neomarinimicrobiota bacterium]MBL7030735.1 hypothetical protein [Candidatus Neomarinimicrobiota bacterium]
MVQVKRFVIILFSLFSCEDKKTNEICIDENKIRNDVDCITIYFPVCGCDKKTYGNACEAERAGVTSWTIGECE